MVIRITSDRPKQCSCNREDYMKSRPSDHLTNHVQQKLAYFSSLCFKRSLGSPIRLKADGDWNDTRNLKAEVLHFVAVTQISLDYVTLFLCALQKAVENIRHQHKMLSHGKKRFNTYETQFESMIPK